MKTLQALASGSSSSLGFDLAAFHEASSRGLALGLKGDVSAANLVVEKRKSALFVEIQRKVGMASAGEFQGESGAGAWSYQRIHLPVS